MATKKKRRSWLAVEVKALRTAAKNIVPAGKIARLIKRTEGAIRQKALALGLSLILSAAAKARKKPAAGAAPSVGRALNTFSFIHFRRRFCPARFVSSRSNRDQTGT